MNDRYLFRAKRIDDGKWIIGNLIDSPDGKNAIAETSAGWLIYDVDPSTICQCTGLKDKNGKLIWENDIVKPFADLKGIVRFGERDYSREFGFNIEWISKPYYRRDFLYWAEKCKVIGSAIDNPELLEQEG